MITLTPFQKITCVIWDDQRCTGDIRTRCDLWCPPICLRLLPSWGVVGPRLHWGRRSPCPAWSRYSAPALEWSRAVWGGKSPSLWEHSRVRGRIHITQLQGKRQSRHTGCLRIIYNYARKIHFSLLALVSRCAAQELISDIISKFA